MNTPTRSDYKKIFQQSSRSCFGPIVLFKKPGSGKVGVTVSRSLGCHAYKNRIRRCAKMAALDAQHLFPEGYDYVILVRKWDTDMGKRDVSSAIMEIINLTFGHTYNIERERRVIK